jgi:hypothetical protein
MMKQMSDPTMSYHCGMSGLIVSPSEAARITPLIIVPPYEER